MQKLVFPKPLPTAIAVSLALLIWFVIPVPKGVAPNAWHLLALTGGAPMALFGEWEPGPQLGRWRLLSAWQADESGQVLRKLWQNQGEVL